MVLNAACISSSFRLLFIAASPNLSCHPHVISCLSGRLGEPFRNNLHRVPFARLLISDTAHLRTRVPTTTDILAPSDAKYLRLQRTLNRTPANIQQELWHLFIAKS